MIPGKGHSSVTTIFVMAGDTVPIENGLDIPGKVDHLGHIRDRFQAARRAAEREAVERAVGGHGRPLFMAADTACRLTGHQREEALHPLHRQIAVVQSHEEQASQCRQFGVGGAIRLDRDGAQDAFQGESASVAERFHPSGVVHRFRECLQHEQLLDLTRLHALHVASLQDVRHQDATGRLWLHRCPRRRSVPADGRTAAGVRGTR